MAGCVPDFSTYNRPEIPQARYFPDGCDGFGARSVAYYPFHGIYISLSIDPVSVGLHIPAGTTAKLDGDTVVISAATERGPLEIHTRLKAAPHGSVGNIDPDEFRGLPDPYTPDAGSRPLIGGSKEGRLIWYLFIGMGKDRPNQLQLVPIAFGGTIELPPITVNDRHYPAQVLPFTRKRHVGIQPVNC